MRSWSPIVAAVIVTLPALYIRAVQGIGKTDIELPSVAMALIFGGAIMGAAFLLSWAADVAEMDISQALALALISLVVVLPEYSVSIVLSWKAGADPTGPYTSYASANMTGANRLLVGLGWPLVVLLHWFKHRKSLQLEKGISLELVVLGLATLFSFSVFLQRSIQLWHAAVLLGIFGFYIWLGWQSKVTEPELYGPSQAIASLAKPLRRLATVSLFVLSALTIVVSAEPFVEALLGLGQRLNVDRFILIQWVAPLASEAPELVLASIFVLRGASLMALATLISAKVNQWTLLVASIPVTFSTSLGSPEALPLDSRQVEEFLLTSAQSLLAVVLLARLRLSGAGALILFMLFGTQLFFTATSARYIYSYLYLALVFGILLVDRGRWAALWQRLLQVRERLPGVEIRP